jgi:hypothetical protein
MTRRIVIEMDCSICLLAHAKSAQLDYIPAFNGTALSMILVSVQIFDRLAILRGANHECTSLT